MTEPIPPFDVGEADRLLMTTRAVRRRLDVAREVPDRLLLDCIDVAEQAPSGGNDASRRWLIVRDPERRARLGQLYREQGEFMLGIADRLEGTNHDKERVFASSAHLIEHFAEAPVLVIAAIWGEHDNSGRPGLFDSVIQAGWSFNLALRARGLGSTWTTMLNADVDGLAAELGIPDGVTTIVTFPVAWTIGTNFSPVQRRPATEITYFDQWGFTRASASADGSARVVDGPGVAVEIDINARPHTVWSAVTDIDLPARFSNEFVGARWLTDPGPGGSFRGTNVRGDRSWEVDCHVTQWTENRVFEWSTTDRDDPGAIWRFELTEMGTRTRLRFAMCIGANNNGTATRALTDGADEEAVLNTRRHVLKDNMQATVEGLRDAVEKQSR